MKVFFRVFGLVLVLSMGIAAVASAEDFKQFGVRMRGIYVKPNEGVDNRLGGIVKISDDIIPELDFEYFFHKNFSAEAIAGVTRNDIKINGTFSGSTWLLPPTVTLKYHPLAGNKVSPYVGFGANATFPFNSKLTSVGNSANGVADFSIDNSIGWAAQIGTDIKLKDDLYFNIDYKYINVDTQMKIAGVKYDLNLNPNLFGFGLGYRF